MDENRHVWSRNCLPKLSTLLRCLFIPFKQYYTNIFTSIRLHAIIVYIAGIAFIWGPFLYVMFCKIHKTSKRVWAVAAVRIFRALSHSDITTITMWNSEPYIRYGFELSIPFYHYLAYTCMRNIILLFPQQCVFHSDTKPTAQCWRR